MLFTKLKIKRLIKKLKSMQQYRIHNQPTAEMLQKEREGYHKLAQIYQGLIGKKHYPFAALMVRECYRSSSTIEDSEAQYLLARSLLDEANYRHHLQKNPILTSPGNEREMKQRYEEAHAYLEAAAKLNHIEAKRLQGLCFINAWGVAEDKKKGFELVLASIEQENSWDQVPQIFAAIGLNKPEFYTALTQFRNKH